jgi:hypothetical protein
MYYINWPLRQNAHAAQILYGARPHQGLSSWAWARATAAIRSCPVRREVQAALPDLQAVSKI